MHFDQRTQAALREVGLSMAEIQDASDHAVTATQETATGIEAFFGEKETVYSNMDRAHSSGGVQEHTVEYVDCYTHAADIRGYLRFEDWGVPIEGGRVLDDGSVELALGPTVHDRVRFVDDPDQL